MKKLLFVVTLLMVVVAGFAKGKTVKNPPVAFVSTSFLEIGSVTLTDTSTVIVMEAFTSPGAWLSLPKTTFLTADGENYALKSSSGIQLDEPHYLPKTGRDSFTLYFEPLPKNTERFDFIDSLGHYMVMIHGVELTGKFPLLDIDKRFTEQQLDYNAPMPEPVLTAGKARLKGRITEWNPLFQEYYELKVTGMLEFSDGTNIPLNVEKDGSFDVEFDVQHTKSVTLDAMGEYLPVYVSPGQTTEIVVNQREITRSVSRLRKDVPSDEKKVYFTGPWAAFNDEMLNNDVMKYANMIYDAAQDSIVGMNIYQYRDVVLKAGAQLRAQVQDDKSVSDNFKRMADIVINKTMVGLLAYRDFRLQQAYRKANNIKDYNAPLTNFKPLDLPDVQYFAALKNFDFDNVYSVISGQTITDGLSYILWSFNPNNDYVKIKLLEDKGLLSESDKQVVAAYKSSPSKETSTALGQMLAKFQPFMEQILKDFKPVEFGDIITIKDGYVGDLMASQEMAHHISQMQPVTAEQMTKLLDTLRTPLIREVITNLNDKLLAKIELNKSKTNYSVVDVAEVVPENLLQWIVDRHKGKVLFIDFWATWCSPCRSAMTRSEPVKEQLKGKDVVFIYITNGTSPDGAWRNMMVDIPGEHYMLTKEQFAYMSAKEYQFSGIPSYAIVGRDGQKIHFQTGFMGASAMQKYIEEQLQK